LVKIRGRKGAEPPPGFLAPTAMFSPQHNSKLTVKKYKSAQIECFSFAPNPTSTGEGIPLPTFFAAKINHPSLAQPFKPLVHH